MTLYAQNVSGEPISLADQTKQIYLYPGTVTILPLWAAQLPGFSGLWAAGKVAVSESATMSPLITSIPASELPGGMVATLIAPVAVSSATQTKILSLLIPANSVAAGTTFRIKGFANQGGVNGIPTLNIYLGTTGTTSDTLVAAGTVGFALGGNGVMLDAAVTVLTLGASGTAIGNACTTQTGDGTMANFSSVAMNTTVANFLTLAAAVTAGTLTANNVVMEALS